MRLTTYIAFLFLVLSTLHPYRAHGDKVVLNSGETFTSPEVWEENGKIRFNMQGLVVSVGKDEVAAIIRDGRPSAPPPEQRHSAPATQTPAPPLDQSQAQPQSADSPQIPQPSPTARQASSHGAQRSPIQKGKSVRGTGLAGIDWQMKAADIPGLVKLKTEPEFGGIDQYYFPGQDPVLGRALLDGLVYSFWHNKLYSITAWVDGRPGYERLKAEVQTRYGQGQANHNGLERLVWQDQTSDRLLEFDSTLNTGLFWMRSRQVDARLKQLYPQ